MSTTTLADAEQSFNVARAALSERDAQLEAGEKALAQAKFEMLQFESILAKFKKEISNCEVDIKTARYRQVGLNAEKQQAADELAKAITNPNAFSTIEKAFDRVRRLERESCLIVAELAAAVSMSVQFKKWMDMAEAARAAAEKRAGTLSDECEAARRRRDAMRDHVAETRLKLAEIRQAIQLKKP
ncbi:hypothetical protein AW736_26270 [Termitidicoccus mucosus]|uniref:Uncharacterized protein n=1 Tax=Termitidicoccus mucosus TaxID=1184151 RepID=A0A178IQ59_9BACT|nr:hypothetical protein AW736_26270 [Opitutaceae bacterium TSB47]